jgi:hypothetical protein
MSGMEPMLIGAAAGAALNRKNPLQGALMGGTLGGAGGALFPNALSSLAPAAETGILPSVLSGSTTAGANIPAGAAFVNPAGVNAMTSATTGSSAMFPSGILNTEAAKTGLFGGGMPTTNVAMQGQGLAQTTAMQRPLSLGMPGVEASSLYEPTFMDKVGQLGQYAQQNPTLTAMAAQSAQQMMQQPQRRSQPPGLLRGNQMQVAAPQYQVGVPQVSLI